MKHYTMGFSFLFFSFVAILILLYFGGLTRQVEKNIDIIKSEINHLNDKFQVNELEYAAHTSSSYLKQLADLYLINKYNEEADLNIVSIQDIKNKKIHKVFRVKEN